MMFPLRVSRVPGVTPQNLLQMTAKRLATGGVLPSAIWHNPVNFPYNSLSQRQADKVRDRQQAVVVKPPHVVMSIDVHQDAVLESCVAPEVIGLVVILHQVHLPNRVDSDPGGGVRCEGGSGHNDGACKASNCE